MQANQSSGAAAAATDVKKKKKKRTALYPGQYRRNQSPIIYYRKTVNGVDIDASTGVTDPDDADEIAQEWVRQARKGDRGIRTKVVPTLNQWWDHYFKTWSKAKKTKGAEDEVCTRHFREQYGKLRLTDITSDLCQQWINLRSEMVVPPSPLKKKKDEPGDEIKPGKVYSPNTILGAIKILKAIFRKAMTKGKYLHENPWHDLILPKPRLKTRVLTLVEQAQILKSLRLEYMKRAILVVLGSGLRNAEFLALRPCDVRDGSIFVLNGKGEKAREIPVRDEIIEIIDQQRIARGLSWGSGGFDPVTGAPTDTLFDFHRNTLTQALMRVSRRLGIPHLSAHDLRRTYATRAALGGMNPKVLMLLMGHATIEITMRYYVAVDIERLKLEVRGTDYWQIPVLGPRSVRKRDAA